MAYTSQDRRVTGRLGGLRKAANEGRPGAAEELAIVELEHKRAAAQRRAKEAVEAAEAVDTEIAKRVRQIVAQAPALSPAQRTKLAAILGATASGDAA